MAAAARSPSPSAERLPPPPQGQADASSYTPPQAGGRHGRAPVRPRAGRARRAGGGSGRRHPRLPRIGARGEARQDQGLRHRQLRPRPGGRRLFPARPRRPSRHGLLPTAPRPSGTPHPAQAAADRRLLRALPLAHHPPGLPPHLLPLVLPRESLRPPDPGLPRLAPRPGEGARPGRGPGIPRAHGSLRRPAPRAAHLVDLGIGRPRVLGDRARGPGARLHRTPLQQVPARPRRGGAGGDPGHGPRQGHPGRRRVRDRHLAPQRPHHRLRGGRPRDHAHRHGRHHAKALHPRRDPHDHGPRDGPLRAQPRVEGHRPLRGGHPARLPLPALGLCLGGGPMARDGHPGHLRRGGPAAAPGPPRSVPHRGLAGAQHREPASRAASRTTSASRPAGRRTPRPPPS